MLPFLWHVFFVVRYNWDGFDSTPTHSLESDTVYYRFQQLIPASIILVIDISRQLKNAVGFLMNGVVTFSYRHKLHSIGEGGSQESICHKESEEDLKSWLIIQWAKSRKKRKTTTQLTENREIISFFFLFLDLRLRQSRSHRITPVSWLVS